MQGQGGAGCRGSSGADPSAAAPTLLARTAPQPETKGSSVETVARLDTGSSRRNFIRQDLADELISRGSRVVAVEGGAS